MSFLDLAGQRHTYRGEYLDTPVTREQLDTIILAATLAPAGCNENTTEYVVLDDPACLKEMAAILEQPRLFTAPAGIIVLGEPKIVYGDTTFYVENFAAAILSMLFAIVDLGLASAWIEGQVIEGDRAAKIAALLAVPAEKKIVCYLPIGVAKEEKAPPKKPGVAEVISYNAYGKK